MCITVTQATSGDLNAVAGVIREAIDWLNENGVPMWRGPAFEPAAIAESLSDYYLAKREFDVVGVMKLEMEDITFWPDVPSGDSLFVHRLAVRRAFSGGPISTALLDFARSEAIRRERRYLRLDCAADRPKLRNVYESFGFRYHSDKTVGTFTVARYEYKIK